MPDRAIHEFAVELRQLAYTMPAGHEDRLIRLSERMDQRAMEIRRLRTGT